MTWSKKALILVGCMALAACSGSGGRGATKLDDAGSRDGSLVGDLIKVPGDLILPGDEVDLDGDGAADGVGVDLDGDGTADGIDTNGDGVIDQLIPHPPVDGGSTTGITVPSDPVGSVLCNGLPCGCNDGLDNDADGVTDLADPECVSSWDNDEGSLATGIPGDNRDEACQDCFFDGNSGSGNDGCRLPTSCLLLGNNSSGRGSCSSCEQTDKCKNFCEAYTPNGCDCFGCCGINVGGTVKHVLLETGCDINGTQLSNCTECVPSTTCVNTCGRCELCPGKTINDLPADCAPTPPTPGTDAGTGGGTDGGTGEPPPPPPPFTCEGGATVCGSGLAACDSGSLCQFGCCVRVPILI